MIPFFAAELPYDNSLLFFTEAHKSQCIINGTLKITTRAFIHSVSIYLACTMCQVLSWWGVQRAINIAPPPQWATVMWG